MKSFKQMSRALALLATCAWAACSAAATDSTVDAQKQFLAKNRDLVMAVINGEQFREAYWKMLANPDSEGGAIFGDAQNYLVQHEVVLSGALKSLTESRVGRWTNLAIEKAIEKLGAPEDWKKVAAARWTLTLTIGQHNQQPVNIVCKIDEKVARAVEGLQIGAPVAVRGKVADSWFVSEDVVLIDVQTVASTDLEQVRAALPLARSELMWDCLMLPHAFSSLPDEDRVTLARMARLALMAYPSQGLPAGVQALTRDEWTRVADGKLAEELYTDDGYFVVGDGLRARLMKWGDVLVIALSGCDFSLDTLNADWKDFVVAVQHIWKGDVEEQYRQAYQLCRGVLNIHQGPVWIVGHSLGGSLVSYASISLGGDPRVRFATFNGLGVAARYLPKGEASEGLRRIGPAIVNIYSDRDLVYTGHRLLRWTGFEPPRHLGRSYFMEYRDPAAVQSVEKPTVEKIKWDQLETATDWVEAIKQMLADLADIDWSAAGQEAVSYGRYYHSMTVLAAELEKASPPFTFEIPENHMWIWLAGGSLVGLLALGWVWVRRKSGK